MSISCGDVALIKVVPLTGHAMYKIRIVDASDDDVVETLADLHRSTFFDAAPMPQFDVGAWLMRAVEARGRRVGWSGIVSDTTDNHFSANNFIKAGYRLFEPEVPWAWSHTLYWRRSLR